MTGKVSGHWVQRCSSTIQTFSAANDLCFLTLSHPFGTSHLQSLQVFEGTGGSQDCGKSAVAPGGVPLLEFKR